MRRSLPLFLAVVACLVVWQVWLTWRLMQQDRNLESQRSHERLQQVADLAVTQLAGTLDNWDLSLRGMDRLPPQPALPERPVPVLLLFTQGSVAVYPSRPLLFVPNPPAAPDDLPRAFAAADQLEFRDQKYDRAIEVLDTLASQPAARPEALLRLGRMERNRNRMDAALAAFDHLLRENAVSSSGAPYGLLAARARCEILAELGNPSRAAEAADSLRGALLAGQWPLSRESFESNWAEVNQLRHTAEEPPKDSLDLALAVSRAYEMARSRSTGREIQSDESLIEWRASAERTAALLAPAGWLGASLKLPPNSSDIRWRLVPPGQPGTDAVVSRSLADAQLAGRLDFSSGAAVEMGTGRRALWLAGVALMLALVLAGSYAMYRGMRQELRVAQLQSDFVSAVSHEFRSPLTTLSTIAELLAHDRIADEPRRRQSYQFLERETGRLQRLVEDLLDFGRMESGRKQYSMEPHDALALTRAAVAEFREDSLASGFEVEMHLDSRAATVKADEEALRRALRNLLENAVKYSPACRTVWVEGAVNGGHVAISVRDEGMGIDPREQREVFQKFVRGSAAKKAGIKGTGIGLSMVRQIVDALGGELRLESALGAGSTFTVVLPLLGESRAQRTASPAGDSGASDSGEFPNRAEPGTRPVRSEDA